MKKAGKIPYFIDKAHAPKFRQMKGLETTILTGFHGEKMMIVLNSTLPGHRVPVHSHPHEQIGMVYSGKALLRIGDEKRIVRKATSTASRPTFPTAIQPSEMNPSSC